MLPQRSKEQVKMGINVLGMITLNDLDRITEESKTGHGWIACPYLRFSGFTQVLISCFM